MRSSHAFAYDRPPASLAQLLDVNNGPSSSGGRTEVSAKPELECHKRSLGIPLLMLVGEELRRVRAAEKECSRMLDERAKLEEAGVRAVAAEEARIMTNKV